MLYRYFCLLMLLIGACTSKDQNRRATEQNESLESIGDIERLDQRMDEIIAPGTVIEVLADGFDWVEGPLWVKEGGYLLFSDIPPNRIYRWKEDEGVTLYLEPSGYTDTIPRGGEKGSNGLLLREGHLLLCQHGDRRVARMDAPLNTPEARFVTLADNFLGNRLNSPNDMALHRSGDLYFTDPPYGLEKRMDDPLKELSFQGVYRLSASGEMALLTDKMSRPNGIAFSPDGTTLYVANSDPEKAIWMRYDIDTNGEVENSQLFFDATDRVPSQKGLPDGLKVNREGTVFATGPGGVLIFSPEGEHLGSIKTGEATSNCAFDDQQRYLYITADSYLLRVKLNS